MANPADDKKILGPLALQKGAPFVAAKGDEVQVSAARVAFQFSWHRAKQSPPFAKDNYAKGRAPSSYHFRVNDGNGIVSSCLATGRRSKRKDAPSAVGNSWILSPLATQ